MLKFFILSCFWIAHIQGQEPLATSSSLSFTIANAWNGAALNEEDRINITLVGDTNSLDVQVIIQAPFYNDPPPNAKPGDKFKYMWETEVAEVYFLNDANEYFQVQLGPYGHYKTLFFNESRSEIAYALPLEYEANINGSTWSGTAVIPGKYFPANVTKFNAGAINGYVNLTTGNFAQLYPADSSATQPDFHNLALFEPIDMSALNPQFADGPVSPFWESLLRGEFELKIKKTWDLLDLYENDQIKVILKKVENRDGVLLRIEAPFFNDTAPPADPGSHFVGLWDYEVVEVYFLNCDDQYLQIEIAPQGQYMVSLFNGKHNYLQYTLPLDVTSNISNNSWTAETIIPKEYFPPAATKISASAMHGPQEHRHFYTLTPTPVVLREPDFHNLAYYQTFDIGNLIPSTPYRLSPLWNSALEGEFNFIIRFTWDGQPLKLKDYVNVNLEPVEGSLDLAVRIDAPFYNDPSPPDAAPGESYNNLKDYEAVEVYFLNDADQYLQIQVSPLGQYFVMFYEGERHLIRHTLPLDVSSSIEGSRWTSDIIIPGEYLPEKITKFQAAASNGPEDNRTYKLLKASFGPEATVPDYHKIHFYKDIVIDNLSPIYNMASMSTLWETALAGEFLFIIDETLDGHRLFKGEEIAISLQRIDESPDIFVRIEAPFYNDTAPEAEAGPFQGIWKYEVVDLYFSNKNEQYLQIQIGPHGQYWVLLLNGTRNVIKNALPLNSTSVIVDSAWIAEATIPGDYFPPQVRLFNAAAMHGVGDHRHYISVNSLPDGATQEKPDFHDFRLFQPFDMREGVHGPDFDDSQFSAIWQEALQSEQEATTVAF